MYFILRSVIFTTGNNNNDNNYIFSDRRRRCRGKKRVRNKPLSNKKQLNDSIWKKVSSVLTHNNKVLRRILCKIFLVKNAGRYFPEWYCRCCVSPSPRLWRTKYRRRNRQKRYGTLSFRR